MRAFILKGGGGIENLILAEVQRPSIGPGEVQIKTKAISINPVDISVINDKAVRDGLLQPVPGEDIIGGWDIAGEVMKVGENVQQFKKGDRVFGCINFPGQGRVYAECVAAPAAQLVLIPEGISYESAAAACMAAVTAWQALVTYGHIGNNHKILIHGSAGGVGHLAVQIAKSFGAYVIGTASAKNLDFVLAMGADKVIDYKKDKFEEIVSDADLIIDSINSDNLMRSLDAVKTGGRIVSIIAQFDGRIAEKIKQKKITGIRMELSSNGDDGKSIAGLLSSGQLQPALFKVFGFQELPQAAKAMASVGNGKIVIQVG